MTEQHKQNNFDQQAPEVEIETADIPEAEIINEQEEQEEQEEQVVQEQAPKFNLKEQINHNGIVSLQAIEYLQDFMQRLTADEVGEEEYVEVLEALSYLTQEQYEKASRILTVENDLELQRINGARTQLDEEKRRLQRVRRDTENATAFANEKVVKNALKPLFMNLELAANKLPRDTGNADFDSFREELTAFNQKFQEDLKSHGLELYGAVGDKFDPNLHDAVAQYPYQTLEQAGTLAHVVSKGYKLNDRVIIPASVVAFQADE